MRHMSRIKRLPEVGFTLIEILIIAPIVILVISGFVGLMIMMVGDVLVTRDQNSMSYETQDALDLIEQDTHLSTQFLATTGNLPSPQGSDSNFAGTTPFTNTSSTLIFGGLTTNKNPADSTRELIYYNGQPNDCGAQRAYNRVLQAKIIYFLKDGSLWRRAILPDFNTNIDNTLCANPWQRNTCSPGYSTSTRCQTNDSRLMDHVETFNVKYFNSPSSITDIPSTQALSATTIEVTLQGKKTTAGRDISNSGSLRATKLNNIDVELPAPDSPSVYGQANGNNAVFTWEKVPLASSYAISYYVNGVGPTTATVNAQTTSHTVNASPLATVTMSVTARNSTGLSAPGTATVTIPAPTWTDCASSTGWTSYDINYAPKGVLKTDAGIVYVKGLIRAGTTAVGTTVCNLPVGFRPSIDLTFITSTNGGTEGAPARLDVQTDGDVVIQAIPANTWLSLNTIRFVASTAPYTPTPITPIPASAWVPWGAPYSNLQSIVDSTGRVHLQGLLKNGNFADWTSVANLPVGQRPSHIMTFPTTSNTAFNQFSLTNTGNGVVAARGINGSGYWSIQSMHYPYTYNGWTPLTLEAAGGWVPFDATTFSQPSYTKATDGAVTLRGTIKNGSTAAGTVIAKLPPGYRPKERLLFTADSNGAWSRVDIFANGDVVLRFGYSGFFSLDGISFMAEQ